jgi:beta-lactamase regulating signal transducer with metallopeptidase domain
MHSWSEFLISNAIVATALALLVSIVTWFPVRPAARHLLWLIVLLKLVTPPLMRVEWPAAITSRLAIESETPLHDAEVIPQELETPASLLTEGPNRFLTDDEINAIVWEEAAVVSDGKPVPLQAPDASSASASSPTWSSTSLTRLWTHWAWLLGVIWLAGSFVWFLLAGIRLARFYRRALSPFRVDSHLQQLADEVARKLGLGASPPVRVTEAALPPMLASLLGRNVIVLPRQLLETLTPDQLAAILAHELAHYRRGDHWTRWIEFLVLGIYWWHPVAWHARRQLQDAEELCCDAWVVCVFPDRAKCYAQALLTTVDFLAEVRTPAPAGASAFGPVRALKRRLQMILSRRHSPELPALARTAMLIVALSVLPWTPRVFSQSEPPAEPAAAPAATATPASAAVPATPATATQEPAQATPPAAPEAAPSTEAANPLGVILRYPTTASAPPAAELPPPTPMTAAAGSSNEERLDRLEKMLEQLLQDQRKRASANTVDEFANARMQRRSPVEVIIPAMGPAPIAHDFAFPLMMPMGFRDDLKKINHQILTIEERIKPLEAELEALKTRRAQITQTGFDATAEETQSTPLSGGYSSGTETELIQVKRGDHLDVVGRNRKSGAEVFRIDTEAFGGIRDIHREDDMLMFIGWNGKQVVVDLNTGKSLPVPRAREKIGVTRESK